MWTLKLINSGKTYNDYLLPGIQTMPDSPIIVLSHMLYIYIFVYGYVHTLLPYTIVAWSKWNWKHMLAKVTMMDVADQVLNFLLG